ncbi:sulfite exporter TauE/SafE family protein [Candidatus Kaiserbacteria bacterium]|nr:MAG: sulfite exporter TauE/SafE family protein [Candidatus Kaiserbacteria bacterium]
METLLSNMLFVFFFLCTIAFVCELIDSSIGMGYGTILSPLLLILGFGAHDAVPAILISQMIGGALAARQHHILGNAYFNRIDGKLSPDTKAVLIISVLGIFASLFAAYVGTHIIEKSTLNYTIGGLVLLMAFVLMMGFTFEYTTGKMFILGIVSAFNKGLSGGGFGPLVTGGQVVMGKGHRSAIGVTTLAEVLICLVGFMSYVFYGSIERWDLVAALCIGSALGSSVGPKATLQLSQKELLKKIIPFVLLVLGTLTILKTSGVIHLNVSM